MRFGSLDELIGSGISSFPDEGFMDCDMINQALELLAKETGRGKKVRTKINLQQKLMGLFAPVSDGWTLESFGGFDRKPFISRMMEVLAGGDLDQTEIRITPHDKQVTLKRIQELEIDLPKLPFCFSRENDGVLSFALGKGEAANTFSLPISINPVDSEKFQIFTYLQAQKNESDKLRGWLFSKEGKLVLRVVEENSLAGCFDSDGAVLLVNGITEESSQEEQQSMLRFAFQVKSADGKKAWSKALRLAAPEYGESGARWSLWPSATRGAWTAELWSLHYSGFGHAYYYCWDITKGPNISAREVCGISLLEEDPRPLRMGPIAKTYRYDRSSAFHSTDALGRVGFEVNDSRHHLGPIVMKNYASQLKPTQRADADDISAPWDTTLCLPRTSEASPQRNSWPDSTHFFVGSVGYEPVFNAFLRARRGDSITAADLGNNETGLEEREDGRATIEAEESATFFYDPSGDLKAWSMGYIAGDAEDGKSLLVTRASGHLLTVSPEYKVTAVRTFVTPDGKEAKPLLMLDSHHAGIFLVGKSIVAGTWKPPLLQRLFSRSGKYKSSNASN